MSTYDASRRIGTLCCLLVFLASANVEGQHRPFASVPPSLEIEVLDPGVDSLGNPAVQLEDGTIEIPPVVLVHRYYYSGDRSFQGPMLPGGPSIIVFNHPKTGERTYVSAQMMPGAPRVTYTKKGITYQYEKHAIRLQFGLTGEPKIKYQSGLSVKQRVSQALHIEQIGKKLNDGKQKSKDLARRSKTALVGLTAEVAEGAKIITVPTTNILQSLPFGKRLFTGELEPYLAEKAALMRRDIGIKRLEKQRKLDEVSIPTLR